MSVRTINRGTSKRNKGKAESKSLYSVVLFPTMEVAATGYPLHMAVGYMLQFNEDESRGGSFAAITSAEVAR